MFVNFLSDDLLKFYSACAVEPILIPKGSSIVESVPYMSRYYYYHQWLSKHVNEVDRVLHSDTFDVLFQSDPFITEMSRDKLYFTFEPVKLKDSVYTVGWMEQCYGKEKIHKYDDRYVSCSGVTGGGAFPFLKYLEIMLSNPVWTSCYGDRFDQAHHNYQLYAGDFRKAGIEIVEFGCQSPFITMHFCCKHSQCSLNSSNILTGPNSKEPPIILHQYNRFKDFRRWKYNICPREPNSFSQLDIEPAQVQKLPPLQAKIPMHTVKNLYT